MNTNKVLKICGFVCLLCGIIIAAISFTDVDVSTYNKVIGPLQIVVGFLFLLNSKKKKSE